MGIYDDIPEDKAEVKQEVPAKKARKKRTPKKTAAPKKKVVAKKAPKEKKTVKKEKEAELSPKEFFDNVKPVPDYVKHLVKCRCVLPQFMKLEEPPDHQFIVFSPLNEQGMIDPHYAQCNNCGLIHKVFEVGVSQTLKKETLMSLPTIKDLKFKLPERLSELLEENQCELHTWLEAEFIVKHGLWGRFVVLAKERDEHMVLGKVLQILGENLYNIETFERDESYVEP